MDLTMEVIRELRAQIFEELEKEEIDWLKISRLIRKQRKLSDEVITIKRLGLMNKR